MASSNQDFRHHSKLRLTDVTAAAQSALATALGSCDTIELVLAMTGNDDPNILFHNVPATQLASRVTSIEFHGCVVPIDLGTRFPNLQRLVVHNGVVPLVTFIGLSQMSELEVIGGSIYQDFDMIDELDEMEMQNFMRAHMPVVRRVGMDEYSMDVFHAFANQLTHLSIDPAEDIDLMLCPDLTHIHMRGGMTPGQLRYLATIAHIKHMSVEDKLIDNNSDHGDLSYLQCDEVIGTHWDSLTFGDAGAQMDALASVSFPPACHIHLGDTLALEDTLIIPDSDVMDRQCAYVSSHVACQVVMKLCTGECTPGIHIMYQDTTDLIDAQLSRIGMHMQQMPVPSRLVFQKISEVHLLPVRFCAMSTVGLIDHIRYIEIGINDETNNSLEGLMGAIVGALGHAPNLQQICLKFVFTAKGVGEVRNAIREAISGDDPRLPNLERIRLGVRTESIMAPIISLCRRRRVLLDRVQVTSE